MKLMGSKLRLWLLLFVFLCMSYPAGAIVSEPQSESDFYAFESDPVRPVALTPDKKKLLVTNIPDGNLDIFTLDAAGNLTHEVSVPVGMEPVAVAARTNTEIWVVNQLSDSVSVVDISKEPYTVTRTLLVGDEPRDIVFAGPDHSLAFITTAHRGQHRTHPSIQNVPGAGDPKLTTQGIPRADIWVFDVNDLGTALGGLPKKIIELFGDTPRALAVNKEGDKVYAAIFYSGNQTTIVHDGVVPDTWDTDPGESHHLGEPLSPELPSVGLNDGKPTLPGGMLLPLEAYENMAPTYPVETGLIVKFDNVKNRWYDNHARDYVTGEPVYRNWNYGVRFTLPDYDVFEINAALPNLDITNRFSHVGTILYNMAVNPVDGQIFVTNTDANNLTRYAGPPYEIAPGLPREHTFTGKMHSARVTVINPETGLVTPRHLNKHIDYTLSPKQMWATDTKDKSLATPLAIEFSNDGQKVYIAAFGSSKIGIMDAALLSNNGFTPGQGHIEVSGGGPCGLALNEHQDKLYVATRFDNGISVIDLNTQEEISHHLLSNPEPDSFRSGRPLLYDARTYSENGEASCASCHVFAGWDGLAWDIGIPAKKTDQKNALCIHSEKSVTACRQNPDSDMCFNDPVFSDPNFQDFLNGSGDLRQYNTMPGPQITPSWKGLQNHGHLHWRGDTNNRRELDDQGVIQTSDGNFQNNCAVCFDKENPIDYDEMLSLRNLTTAHPGFNGNVEPKVTPDDMERLGGFIFELMQPPNPVRNLDNSLTPSQKQGQDYFFGTLNPDSPNRVTHMASGAPPNHWEEDPQPYLEEEPIGFTCNDCHRVSPEHGFYGTDGHASPSGEAQVMKVPQLRNMYAKIGMFGIPDKDGFRTYPDSNAHMGDQIRGFGFQNNGAMDTLFNYLQGEVFASDDFPDVGFKNQQQRRDVVDYLLAFENDLAPIVGQQITLNRSTRTESIYERIKLMMARASSPWEAKECSGSISHPVMECDLVVRGVVNGSKRHYLYNAANNMFVCTEERSRRTLAQIITLAETAKNSLTFTCIPPGSGKTAPESTQIDGDDTPPSKVTHISPSGAIKTPASTFMWASDPSSTWYKFWVGNSNGDKIFAKWKTAADSCSGGNCSVTPDFVLSIGTYQWYVKSWNEYGKVWSNGMNFTVIE